jgi:transcriptional regulator with PAS, ATPase and Fis domain
VADGGTLFLDEVAELPGDMQVKLLRVLQERELDVVGDPKPRPVDVRILAATNRNLHQSMVEGSFRQDLYYRLSVAPLQIPPLRQRREDIPLLVHQFVEKLSTRFGKEIQLETGVLESLQAYDWPGNVRELENILERMFVFDKKGRVTMEDLPSPFHTRLRSPGRVAVQLPEEPFSLEELERDILVAALEKNGWNQTHAARYLGITRNTLIYRMQKYNLREAGGAGEQPA